MKEEVKVVENIETVGDVVSTENSGKKSFAKVALAAIGVGALVGVIAKAIHKNKDKREAKRTAKQIKNLEKKGYAVLSPDDFDHLAESDTERTTEE